MGISDQLTKHFRTATLLGAGLISAAGVTDQAQAQSFNYSQSYGYRGPGAYGGAGSIITQQRGQQYDAVTGAISSRGPQSYGYNINKRPYSARNDYTYGNIPSAQQNFGPYNTGFNQRILGDNYSQSFGNNRSQGQTFAQPNTNFNSRTQNNNQRNFQGQTSNQQYTPEQTQSQRNSNQSNLNTSARLEQINSAKTSANGDFKYILNLLKEDSQGKLYYSSTHMIIPLNHKLIFMDENTRNPNVNLTKTREHNAQVDKNMAEAIRLINKETNSTMVNYMEKTNSGGKPYYLLSAREFKQSTSSAGSSKTSSPKITRCCCN